MTAILAVTIVLAFIAIGELISIKSKARVPSLLVAMLGLFVFVQVGLIPDDIIDTSTMAAFASLIVPAVMVHMGSLIPLPILRQQWRAVLIALGGMLLGVGFVIAVVSALFDFESAVAGSGPLAGGIVATLLTSEGLAATGIAGAVLLIPSLVLMLQALPSMPLTNFLLRRYAIDLVASGDLASTDTASTRTASTNAASDTVPAAVDGSAPATGLRAASDHHGRGAAESNPRATLIRLPESIATNELFLLFLVFAGGALASYLETWTGVSYSIWGIAIGITATAFGLLPERTMQRANAFSIAIASIVFLVVAPLLTASLDDVLASLLPVLTILGFGMAGILLGGWIVTKLLRWDTRLGMSVSLTAMFGFPADYLISEEVIRSIGRNESEREALRERILPPMLIGGFTSVSAGSIVIASILVDLL